MPQLTCSACRIIFAIAALVCAVGPTYAQTAYTFTEPNGSTGNIKLRNNMVRMEGHDSDGRLAYYWEAPAADLQVKEIGPPGHIPEGRRDISFGCVASHPSCISFHRGSSTTEENAAGMSFYSLDDLQSVVRSLSLGKEPQEKCNNECVRVIAVTPSRLQKYMPGLISVQIRNLCPFGLHVDVTGADGRGATAFYHANETRTQDVEGPNYSSIKVHACQQPGVGEASGEAQ